MGEVAELLCALGDAVLERRLLFAQFHLCCIQGRGHVVECNRKLVEFEHAAAGNRGIERAASETSSTIEQPARGSDDSEYNKSSDDEHDTEDAHGDTRETILGRLGGSSRAARLKRECLPGGSLKPDLELPSQLPRRCIKCCTRGFDLLLDL